MLIENNRIGEDEAIATTSSLNHMTLLLVAHAFFVQLWHRSSVAKVFRAVDNRTDDSPGTVRTYRHRSKPLEPDSLVTQLKEDSRVVTRIVPYGKVIRLLVY